MEYDDGLLRAPLEALARTARLDGRRVGKEWATVHKALGTLRAREEKGEGGGGAEAVCKGLEKVEAKLLGVVKKVEDAAAAQQRGFDEVKRRAAFAVTDAPPRPMDLNDEATARHCRVNTLRLVVHYMLRANLFASARALVDEASLARLVDLHLYDQLAPIVEALRDRGDPTAALAWCGEHRSQAAPLAPFLEARLLVHECVRMARGGGGARHVDPSSDNINGRANMPDVLSAMAFCRSRVAPALRAAGEDGGNDEAAQRLLKDLMGCLAGGGAAGGGGASGRYGYLCSPHRGEALAAEFAAVYLASYNVPSPPLFTLLLQAGVLGLAHDAHDPPANPADPMSAPAFRALARGLPTLARKNSALVCGVTGGLMDGDNPPVVTPAGYLYSRAAVARIAAAHGGVFVCPQTGDRVPEGNMRRVYVL
eukprot:TRINITY_DN22422_c0_g1_i1.p1 TRINITY_DN22422_c0_g1~~TRINITY_DN22422_c0_g1_i1.p1  ORF type:complete len:424 (+),score=163.72 TRINITY_DN22422_c0_g1_i1:94-1365(+)